MVTVIASMANPIGNAIGQVMPTLIVEEGGGGAGMGTLLLVEAVLVTVIGIVAFAVVKERPITPPSASANERFSRVGRGDDTEVSLSLSLSVFIFLI